LKADVAHVRLGWLDELIAGVLAGTDTDTTSLDVPEVDTTAARRTWSLPAAPCEEPPR